MASGASKSLFTVLIGVAMSAGLAAYLMHDNTGAETAEAMALAMPAPRGWSTQDGEAKGHSFGGITASSLTRRYSRGRPAAAVTFNRSAQAVSAARAAGRDIMDPQMRAMMRSGRTSYDVVEFDGWTGWTATPDSGEATATVFRDDLLVQVTLTPPNESQLKWLLDEVDWDTLVNGPPSAEPVAAGQ